MGTIRNDIYLGLGIILLGVRILDIVARGGYFHQSVALDGDFANFA